LKEFPPVNFLNRENKNLRKAGFILSKSSGKNPGFGKKWFFLVDNRLNKEQKKDVSSLKGVGL